MSRQIEVKGRQFVILSEPGGAGPVWKATVLEMKRGGGQEAIGVEATADTRAAADDAAERELRRFLHGQH
jgi:hypothetical protein